MNNDQIALAEAVLLWWDEHQYDSVWTGEDEYNLYDDEPIWVELAKSVLKASKDKTCAKHS